MERLLIFEPGRLAEACLGATAGRPGRHFPAAAAGHRHPPTPMFANALNALNGLIPMVKSVPAVHMASAAGPFGRAAAVWRRPTANTVNPVRSDAIPFNFNQTQWIRMDSS